MLRPATTPPDRSWIGRANAADARMVFAFVTA